MIPAILYCTACLVLIIIATEDFRFRQIHLVYFPVVIAVLIPATILRSSATAWVIMSGINLTVAILVLATGLLVLAVHKHLALQETRNMIGAGDLMMIMILCVSLSLFLFILVFIASLLLALVFCLGCRVAGWPWKKVPLAGFIASVMAVLMAFTAFSDSDCLLDNSVLIQKYIAL